VVANCGAISAGVAESEFFGHRRGAFTGADNERPGLFRAAHGGILFLDEISELNESLQVKLLRVLQEKRVLGVGFDQEVAIDVRVVAATNRNLEEMIRAGSFRQDLYHRLNVLSVNVPPLRERLDDLRPLIGHFLKKYCFLKQNQNTGVGSEFIEALMHLGMPGNVRQLENIIRAAVLNKTDDLPLGLSDLTPAVWQRISDIEREGNGPTESSSSNSDAHIHFRNILDENSWNLPRSLEHCERLLLECVLQSAEGNQSRAARLTGISARSVYNKLHKHKLNV
jgi:transcriptional regulator with PAS, ATPase and Fis domain